jgi:hypothetical protein
MKHQTLAMAAQASLKVKKEKLIRQSFTMPESAYVVLSTLPLKSRPVVPKNRLLCLISHYPIHPTLHPKRK